MIDSTASRNWDQPRRPAWMACWPIARTGVMLVLRRKLFWMLLALAAINFLFMFAVIYLKAQIAEQNPNLANFVDSVLTSVRGTGDTYRDFMFAQGTITMLLLALAGTSLIGDDMRRGGLTYYLSRRINRWHYLLGKLLAIAMLVSLTTTVPALALFCEYGFLTDTTAYFRENWRIVIGILGYGVILSVTLGLLLIAMAAWLQKTAPLVMLWTCLFIMTPALAALLAEVFDDRRWRLLMLWRDIRLLGTWCFGGVDTPNEQALLMPAAGIVLGVCVASFLLILPQIRAVKAVS